MRAVAVVVSLVLAACGTSEEPPPKPAPSQATSPVPASARFADGAYVVRLGRVGPAWRVDDVAPPTGAAGGVVFRAELPSERPGWAGPATRVVVKAMPHADSQDPDVTADATESGRRATELMAAVAPTAR